VKKVLGLDVSSTTVGYSVLSIDNRKVSLMDVGFIKPSKKGTLFERLLLLKKDILSLLKKYNPDEVCIEEIAQFIPRKSTANTIIILAVFNRMIGLTVLEETKKEPHYFSVMSIRSGLKKTKKHPEKFEIPGIVEDYLKIKIPKRIKKTGKIADEYYDQADAIAVALFFCYKETGLLSVINSIRKSENNKLKKSKVKSK